MAIFLPLAGYFIGSLMFSYWLVKLKGLDIRQYGDGNPGAINAFKAGGWLIGIFSLGLDFMKGFFPVFGVVQYFHITDVRLILITIAPVLGHAFSPFLKFRGGKSIAVTFGIWSGLTLWQAPMLLGLVLIFLKLVVRMKNDAGIVLIGMGSLLIYILLIRPSFELLSIFFLNTLILVIKHWSELFPNKKLTIK